MSKTYLYHHNDFDGKSSAAVVQYLSKDLIENVREVNYGYDYELGKIEEGSEVIIVDFSFEPEQIIDLIDNKKCHITWIDHHKSAIEKFNSLDAKYWEHIDGIQRSGTDSGCKLCWEFYAVDEPIPEAIELISDFDCWVYKHGARTNEFIAGLYTVNVEPDSDLWNQFFDPETSEEYVGYIVDAGKNVVKFREKFCEESFNGKAFKIKFEGLDCYAIGLTGLGSFAFAGSLGDVQAGICFGYNGKRWQYGMYSEDPNVDVSKICSKYGGGGHKGAGGFSSDVFLLGTENANEDQQQS